jgi:hypothetical protein
MNFFLNFDFILFKYIDFEHKILFRKTTHK